MNRIVLHPHSLLVHTMLIGGLLVAGCAGTAPRIAGFSNPIEPEPKTVRCHETLLNSDGTTRNTPLCQEPVIPFSYPGSDERIVTFHLDTDRTDIGLWRFRVIAYRVSGLDGDTTDLHIETVKWTCDPHPTLQKPAARTVQIQCQDIPVPGEGEAVWLKASLDWIKRVDLPHLTIPLKYVGKDGKLLSSQYREDLDTYHRCLKRKAHGPVAEARQEVARPSQLYAAPGSSAPCTPPHNLWKGGPHRLVTWFKVKAPD